MALWDGFLECWNDYNGRIDHHVCILDYLKENQECIKPETTKHLLSIGPGTGEIDHGILTLLPHLESYTAVDPDSGALDSVKTRLNEFTGIEKQYVNGMMETYTGPLHSPHVILMSHVAYYFADSFTQQISRALSWLDKEGGRILLVHDQNTVNKLIDSAFDVHSETFDLISVDDVRHHLVTMGANFTESEIPYTLDVSYPGPNYYGFLSVILNRRATREEVDKALTLIRQVFIPGTERITVTQSLFVIQNTSSTQNEDR